MLRWLRPGVTGRAILDRDLAEEAEADTVTDFLPLRDALAEGTYWDAPLRRGSVNLSFDYVMPHEPGVPRRHHLPKRTPPQGDEDVTHSIDFIAILKAEETRLLTEVSAQSEDLVRINAEAHTLKMAILANDRRLGNVRKLLGEYASIEQEEPPLPLDLPAAPPEEPSELIEAAVEAVREKAPKRNGKNMFERQKRCLLLRKKGLTDKEIAAEMGLSIASVNVYISTAKKIMHENRVRGGRLGGLKKQANRIANGAAVSA